MKPGQCYLALILFISLSCGKKQEEQERQSAGNAAPITVCYNPKITDAEWYKSSKKAPLLNGLKGIDFKITTTNPEAQAYFNQGMMLAYGFNHAEAARSFYEAIRLDSACAMAHWGFAYVLGPNYNAGMEEDNFQRAWEAGKKAGSSLPAPARRSRSSSPHWPCGMPKNHLPTGAPWILPMPLR
ncbi:MAG: hypothetical protein ACO1N1_01500 [Dyadobacter fermentans]